MNHLSNRRWLSIVSLLLMAALLAACQVVAPSPAPVADMQTETVAPATTIDIYHFTDYHSHALPAFAEGDPSRGGIARVLGLFEQAKADSPNVLAFSGGDMMNLNNPIWSDAYTCTEWAWFNHVLDGMTVGNHEFDYGADVFTDCSNRVTYPIFSSGLVYSETMTSYLPDYHVYDVAGVKVGAFAVVGNDYLGIVKAENMPAGTVWLTGQEKLDRAAQIVDILRNQEQVDVVISIGHESYEEDVAMAQTVPGIDLILGTHSHLKIPLTQLEGSETYYLAPFQYVNYVSHVTLTVQDGKLTDVQGGLIPMDSSTPTNEVVAQKVVEMQAALEIQYPERFEVLGEAASLIDNGGINLGETGIGNFVTDIARNAAGAHAFFSTSSSFRAALPPGPITREQYLTALPYSNAIVTADMSGAQLLDLLALSASKRGSDSFSQISGLRYTLNPADNTVSDVQVIADPTDPQSDYVPVDPDVTYVVATTNFQALIAGGYKDIFAEAANVTNTGIDINQIVIDYIRENSPVSVELDGRVAQ